MVNPSYTRLKRFLKYGVIAFLSLSILFAGLTWVLFKQKDGWLLKELKTYVNESQSGRLEIGTMELNILGSFPDLEVLFRDIQYYQATADSISVEPIIRADRLVVSLKIIPLLHEQVNISELSLARGHLWLSTDSIGRINLIEALAPPKKPSASQVQTPVNPIQPSKPITPKTVTPDSTSSTVQVDLRQIVLTDFQFLWQPFLSDTTQIVFQELSAELKSVNGTRVAFVKSEHELKEIILAKNEVNLGGGSFSAEVHYETETKVMKVVESNLRQSGIEATLQGNSNFSTDDLEITVDANVYQLEFLKPILHPKVLRGNPNLLKKGRIFF